MRPVFEVVMMRWERGLLCEPKGAGGREKFVEVRGVKSEDEARKLAKQLLDAAKASRTTKAVTGHVLTPAQQPGGGFYIADSLDGMQVKSIAVAMDGEGFTTVTPELGDPLADALAAMQRKLDRANAGVQSEWASPFTGKVDDGQRVDSTVPTFSTRPNVSGGG